MFYLGNFYWVASLQNEAKNVSLKFKIFCPPPCVVLSSDEFHAAKSSLNSVVIATGKTTKTVDFIARLGEEVSILVILIAGSICYKSSSCGRYDYKNKMSALLLASAFG